jgi:homoserine dehydrogenase
LDRNLCLIGKGKVGTQFLKLLQKRQEKLKAKFGISFRLIAIFEYDGALINQNGLDLPKIIESGKNFRKLKDWKDNIKALDYLSKLNIDVCIETTPTNPDTGEPALSHIIESLNNGFDVVTSNKGPFYLKYRKIHELAKQNNCFIKYDATVASCVPALAIKKNLIANEIVGIKAILNGTSNYILSRMTSEGVNFSIALKEAQELGYAESDPELDIEGFDAAGKLVILANELFDLSLTIKDVKIRGISNITPQAIKLAKSDGYVIKHLAIYKNKSLLVEPRLIERNSSLDINGTLNAIEIQTKYAGPIILMGRGAGSREAAAAILNDLISIQQLRDLIKI